MSLLIGLAIAFLVTPVLVVIAYTPLIWLIDGSRSLEDHIGAWWYLRSLDKNNPLRKEFARQ